MKQAKWLTGAVLVAVLIIGGFIFFRNDNVSAPGESIEKTTPTNEETTTPTLDETVGETAVLSPGKYVEYSESKLTDASLGTKILFFHAPWCPQCRELEASIEAGEIPSGVTIIKVDYDSNQSLRSRYGVTIQTSLVKIDDSGNLVKKYVAYDEPSLQSLKENLL